MWYPVRSSLVVYPYFGIRPILRPPRLAFSSRPRLVRSAIFARLVLEQWAQQIIKKVLDCPVVVHDDGSQPSMYDLRIGAVEAPEVAIECVGAVDSVFTETWNVGPGRGPLHLTLKGDWIIGIARETRIGKFRQRIEPILQKLERGNVYNVRVDHRLKRHDHQLFEELKALNVKNASCFRMPGTGLALVEDHARAARTPTGAQLRRPGR